MYTNCIDRKAHSGKHMFYTKSVQKCVLFVYTLVPTTKCTQGKQCDVYFNV